MAAFNELWVEQMIQLCKRSLHGSHIDAKPLVNVVCMRNNMWALQALFPHLREQLADKVPKELCYLYDNQLAPTYLGGRGRLLSGTTDSTAGYKAWEAALAHLAGDVFAEWQGGWSWQLLDKGLSNGMLEVFLHDWAWV